MLFSILIAHYNNYTYFRDCYESILKQTHQNFEIILVDDASTDGSFEKIKDYTLADSRVKCFKNETNKGVGFTKRKAAELASGEICGFIDPDDAITPNAIESAIQQYKNEKTVAVYSTLAMCDQQLNFKKNFAPSKQVKNGDAKFFNIFLEVNHFFTFRKSAYQKTDGINPNITSAVDQDLYLKIYDTGNVKYIPEANYLYRMHDKGVSQEKSKKGKLNENWNIVISDTLKRRNVTKLYGKNVGEISNLSKFIYEKQNSTFEKLKRKFGF